MQSKVGHPAAVSVPVEDTTHYSIIIKDEILLEQNYPNPFNTTTTIEYYVPPTAVSSHVEFHTLDGKYLNTILIKEKGFGMITVELDKQNYLAGSILYTLYVDGELYDTKKMYLVK